jgi:arsenite oxidase small subunit
MSEQTGGKGDKVDTTRRMIIAALGGLAVGGALGYFLTPTRVEVKEVPVTETVTRTVARTETVTAAPPPPQPLILRYPRVRLANVRDLRPGEPLTRQYLNFRVWVVKLGERAVGGIGPDGDVVAFIPICTHMGGALAFDRNNNCAVCPIHYTQFDLTRGGKVVSGHATQFLPQVMLEFDERTGDIYAVGINQLVYGRVKNIEGV